jgi:flagellar basal-body rod protein FlgC
LPATSGSGASGGAGNSSNNSIFPAAFVPLRVNQVDQTSGAPPGGTVATVSTVSPSFVAQSDPAAPFANREGLVAAPNVDLANEFVQLLVAKESFAANAKVIQAFNNTTKSLLDITA